MRNKFYCALLVLPPCVHPSLDSKLVGVVDAGCVFRLGTLKVLLTWHCSANVPIHDWCLFPQTCQVSTCVAPLVRCHILMVFSTSVWRVGEHVENHFIRNGAVFCVINNFGCWKLSGCQKCPTVALFWFPPYAADLAVKGLSAPRGSGKGDLGGGRMSEHEEGWHPHLHHSIAHLVLFEPASKTSHEGPRVFRRHRLQSPTIARPKFWHG